LLAAALAQNPAPPGPASFELVLPSGADLFVMADQQSFDQETRSYLASGHVIIRLADGTELRMDRVRIVMPEPAKAPQPSRYRVEPLVPAIARSAPPRLAAASREETSFEGIGAVLKSEPSEEGYILIDSVVPQAGDDVKQALKGGDAIIQVDGQSVKGVAIEEVVKRIRGPEGTTVKLTLKRPGEEKPLEVSLKRRRIQLPP
jgi:S1-C subfamily serine protease